MAIAIFIEFDNKIIQFPINPEELRVKTDGNNEKVEVVKVGEVNLAKEVKLASLNFESFLPAEDNYPFILTKGDFYGPDYYIDFINIIRKSKKPIRFIVSDTKINMLALIESFEYGYKAGENDIYFTLSLSEYRSVKAKTVDISKYKSDKPVEVSKPREEAVSKKVTPGCEVIVNGRLHRDSYGSAPGQTRSNYRGKVNFVKDDGRSHPYHVTTPDGGWLGWVTKSSVKVV